AQLGSARRHRGNPAAARQGRLLSRKPGRSGSDDEEVQGTADRCQRFAADPAQLASGSLIGHGTDLLRHGIRNLLQPGVVIRGNLYVMVEVAIPGGERHREEQPGYHRVALVRHHDECVASLRYPASMPCHIISSSIACSSAPRLRPCVVARAASLSRTSASTRIVVIAISKVYASHAYIETADNGIHIATHTGQSPSLSPRTVIRLPAVQESGARRPMPRSPSTRAASGGIPGRRPAAGAGAASAGSGSTGTVTVTSRLAGVTVITQAFVSLFEYQ